MVPRRKNSRCKLRDLIQMQDGMFSVIANRVLWILNYAPLENLSSVYSVPSHIGSGRKKSTSKRARRNKRLQTPRLSYDIYWPQKAQPPHFYHEASSTSTAPNLAGPWPPFRSLCHCLIGCVDLPWAPYSSRAIRLPSSPERPPSPSCAAKVVMPLPSWELWPLLFLGFALGSDWAWTY